MIENANLIIDIKNLSTIRLTYEYLDSINCDLTMNGYDWHSLTGKWREKCITLFDSVKMHLLSFEMTRIANETQGCLFYLPFITKDINCLQKRRNVKKSQENHFSNFQNGKGKWYVYKSIMLSQNVDKITRTRPFRWFCHTWIYTTH